MRTIDKREIVAHLHNKKDSQEKETFLNNIKQLFLYGKSRAYTESVVCGHSLIMDIDKSGHLKLVEHKDAEAESTLLSKDSLSHIEIKGIITDKKQSMQEIIQSIDQALNILGIKTDNIVKVQKGVKPGSEVHEMLLDMHNKKNEEINDLLTIKRDLKSKYNLGHQEQSCKSEKQEKVPFKVKMAHNEAIRILQEAEVNNEEWRQIIKNALNFENPEEIQWYRRGPEYRRTSFDKVANFSSFDDPEAMQQAVSMVLYAAANAQNNGGFGSTQMAKQMVDNYNVPTAKDDQINQAIYELFGTRPGQLKIDDIKVKKEVMEKNCEYFLQHLNLQSELKLNAT